MIAPEARAWTRQVERQLEQGWERAEDIAPAQLDEARVQLHHALQLVADVGRKLAADADTEYLPTARGFATGVARGKGPFRARSASATSRCT